MIVLRQWLPPLLLGLVGCGQQPHEVPTSLAAGVSLYLPLDGPQAAAQARYANGSSALSAAGNLSGSAGVVGGALRFPPRASLQIGCPCNIPLRRATLSLWVRWAPESPASGPPQQQTVFRFMGTELMIAAAGNSTTVRFITQGRSHDGNLKLLFDTATGSFAPGVSEWHHIAVAWNESGWKMLRVDAGPAVAEHTEIVPALTDPIASPSSSFALGTAEPYNINTEGLELSEFVAWDRVLSPTELSFCFGQPAQLSRALDAQLPRDAPSRRLVSFELFRPTTAGGVLDPTGSVVVPGQLFNATVPVRAWDSEVRLEVTAVLRGFSGVTSGVVWHDWSTSTLPPNTTVPLRLSVRAPAQRGPYSIDLRCTVRESGAAGFTTLPDTSVASFASWPVRQRASDCTATELFFGSHIPPDACHHAKAGCEADGFEPGAFLQQALRLGYCGPLRDHDMLRKISSLVGSFGYHSRMAETVRFCACTEATKMNYVRTSPHRAMA